ncbi:hypothetical protein FRC06_008841, partial [Ceratobasidium sp. 370]
MNRRTKGMPRFQRLRHFAQGITVISQWNGKEAKALASTLLPIVAGHEDPKVVRAVQSIVDFAYRAHLPELSERDLQKMEEDLLTFDRSKDAFVVPGSTEITERLHIDCVKEPWQATNHNDPIPQMIYYLQKKEAWCLLRSYLHDTGLLIDTRFQDLSDGDEDEDEGPEETVEGKGNGVDGDEGTWLPAPSITIAKRPALGRQRSTYLVNAHKATDLVPATIEFLHLISPQTRIALFEDSYFRVWKRCKLHHKRLLFYPALTPQTDSVRTFPPTIDEEGRLIHQGFFDVVLFSPVANNNSADNNNGLHRLQAGRARAIFELPNHLQPVCSEKLVYLELFQPFPTCPSRTTGLHTTKHAVSGGRRYMDVPIGYHSAPSSTSCTLADTEQTRYLSCPNPPSPSPSIETLALQTDSVHSVGTPASTTSGLRLPTNSANIVRSPFPSIIGLSSVTPLPHALPIHDTSNQVYAPGMTHSPPGQLAGSGEDMHNGTEESELEQSAHNIPARIEMRRQQTVQSERRRRNDMRECFARLKGVLPISTEKCSKINLLERATNYIRALEIALKQAQDKIVVYELELARLRN